MQATIQGVHFDEWPRHYDESFVIAPQGLEGWLEGTETRREETPRPGAHGSFDARVFRAARTVSISGSVLASSEAVLHAMIDQLLGVLADGSKGRLSVQDDHGNVTWVDVRLAGAPSITRHTGHTADYQIQFWAPDPWRYGDLRTFSGSGAQVYHRGNGPAFPVVRVADPVQVYEITSPGGTFRVSGAPTTQGAHEVDMRTGRLRIGGSVALGFVTRAETWAVPAGARWAHSISGGGQVSFIVHDTFM